MSGPRERTCPKGQPGGRRYTPGMRLPYPCTLALALALAGCGDDKSTSDADSAGPTTADTGTSAGPTTDDTAGPTTDATVTADDTSGTTSTSTGTSTTGDEVTTSPTAGSTDGTATGDNTGTATGDDTGVDTGSTTGGGLGEPTLIVNTCAPNDGPAVELRIGVADLTCDSDFPEDAPIFRIVLYKPGPLALGLHPIDGDQGFAYFDDGGGAVVNGFTGAVNVEEETASGARGTYDVALDDGTALAGSFDAIYCKVDTMCG